MENIKKASNWKRALAFIIDLAIYALILQLISIGLSKLFYALGSIKSVQYQARMELEGEIYGSLIAYVLLCFKDVFKGFSIGKKITGICVREAKDPSQVPYSGNLVLRNLTLMIWPIEALLVLLTTDGRRLGDSWCDTQVVEADAN